MEAQAAPAGAPPQPCSPVTTARGWYLCALPRARRDGPRPRQQPSSPGPPALRLAAAPDPRLPLLLLVPEGSTSFAPAPRALHADPAPPQDAPAAAAAGPGDVSSTGQCTCGRRF
eukprot:COSAG01_NODE_4145_length_5299_cov_27.629423_1_plen_115_part_00